MWTRSIGLSADAKRADKQSYMHVETDVLVIGSGGAGMYAAIEAARAGCDVLAGRPQPDRPRRRHRDGADDGRGRARRGDAGPLEPPLRRHPRGRPRPVRRAPGAAAVRGRAGLHPRDGRLGRRLGARGRPHHPGDRARPRPAALRLRRFSQHRPGGVEDAAHRGRRAPRASARPATSVSSISCASTAKSPARWRCTCSTGAPVTIAAKATIVATGGLTRLYRRNSASANMGGDGYALALRAGAPLVDMEFVQFFPIGHLAPRLIGMDPIMWDPFRYKLGGRLLNARWRGVHRALRRDRGRQLRHHARPRHLCHPQGSRGRPRLAAWRRLSELPALLGGRSCAQAFGPVIDRLAKNDIDLTKMPIEVAPIAHYHMGGVIADERMETERAGPLRRRRSGRRRERRQPALRQRHHRGAGVRPARRPQRGRARRAHATRIRSGRMRRAATLDLLARAPRPQRHNTAAMIAQLQAIMADDVGTVPHRSQARARAAPRSTR